jgi:hypothetical protein
MASHARNGTWAIVELPAGRRPIGNKWVFVTKRLADGRVDKLKARLCGKGFTQVYGVDYLNTWSPAVRYKTLRLVLALATRWNLELQQLDVETAFLNARMKEDVYMELPEGYEQQLSAEAMAAAGVRGPAVGVRLVCKLVMCLYGTKQASMEWNHEVNRTLTVVLGFSRSVCDPCLYFRTSRNGWLMLLCLFVDDIMIAHHSDDAAEWAELKAAFTAIYRCKDQGDVYSLLGMRLRRDRQQRVLSIDQAAYLQQWLVQSGMTECKSIGTPCAPGVLLSEADCAPLPAVGFTGADPVYWQQHKGFEQGVGTSAYGASSTRPDLSFTTNHLARFLRAPGEPHFTALKRLMRFVRGSKDRPLIFDCRDKDGDVKSQGGRCGRSQAEWRADVQRLQSRGAASASALAGVRPVQPECVSLVAYCDSDWGGCVDSRRSTTGFVILAFGCAVSWVSRRQKSVALSSTEAEYMALAAVVTEVRWMQQLLAEIGLRSTITQGEDGIKAVQADQAAATPADATSAELEPAAERGEGGAAVAPARGSSSSASSDARSSSPSAACRPCPGCVTIVCSDNQSALSQVRGDSDYHARSKHIDIRYHFVKDAVRAEGGMELRWVPSADQLADVFTKPLDQVTFQRLSTRIMGGTEHAGDATAVRESAAAGLTTAGASTESHSRDSSHSMTLSRRLPHADDRSAMAGHGDSDAGAAAALLQLHAQRSSAVRSAGRSASAAASASSAVHDRLRPSTPPAASSRAPSCAREGRRGKGSDGQAGRRTEAACLAWDDGHSDDATDGTGEESGDGCEDDAADRCSGGPSDPSTLMCGGVAGLVGSTESARRWSAECPHQPNGSDHDGSSPADSTDAPTLNTDTKDNAKHVGEKQSKPTSSTTEERSNGPIPLVRAQHLSRSSPVVHSCTFPSQPDPKIEPPETPEAELRRQGCEDATALVRALSPRRHSRT